MALETYTIKKEDLVKAIREAGAEMEVPLTVQQSTYVLEKLLATISANLDAGNNVRLSGIGVLHPKMRAAGVGRNPATGESIEVPARRVVTFTMSKDLKENMNSPAEVASVKPKKK